MSYATQDIIEALKSARKAKGLSQRTLSARTGVPQSHISKIESGGADIRLSSLVELVRALDLDLKLVPRKAVPAVDSIVRSTAPQSAVTPIIKEINRTLEKVRNLQPHYPDLEALTKLQNNLQTLKALDVAHQNAAQISEITKPIRELQKLAEASRKITDAIKLPAEQLRAIEQAASTAQAWRNKLVHNIPDAPSLPRPAYRLDDNGGNGDG